MCYHCARIVSIRENKKNLERGKKMNATLIIDRDDIKNELHDFLFNDWCEELNLDPDTTDRFTVTVSKAEAE